MTLTDQQKIFLVLTVGYYFLDKQKKYRNIGKDNIFNKIYDIAKNDFDDFFDENCGSPFCDENYGEINAYYTFYKIDIEASVYEYELLLKILDDNKREILDDIKKDKLKFNDIFKIIRQKANVYIDDSTELDNLEKDEAKFLFSKIFI